MFYSVLHLAVWFSIKYSEIKADEIEEFFRNNFLIVLYVIVSFWIVGTVTPFFLKKLIKYFSTIAFHIANKVVKV